MLEIYYGTDVTTVRKKALARVVEYTNRGASLQKIESEQYAQGLLTDMIEAVSLFGEESVYIIDTPTQQADLLNELINCVEGLVESPFLFVVIESKLLAPVKKKLSKAAIYEVEGSKGKERFNTFQIADLLAARDKKNLWVALQSAWREGISNEEIVGILWWQLKTLRLAETTSSAEEAGIKSYPYNKAKQSLKHFSAGEITKLMTSLLAVYHDGHGGVKDFSIGLEEWVLAL